MPHRRRHLRCIFIPLAAAGVGVYLLIGCIPGDHRNLRDGGVRPEEKIGKPGDEKRPIHVGRSTRRDVIGVLGVPRFGSRDARSIVYLYNVRVGYLLNPLCFRADRLLESRYLVLRFGDAGTLESFKVHRRLDAFHDYANFTLPEHEADAARLRDEGRQQPSP